MGSRGQSAGGKSPIANKINALRDLPGPDDWSEGEYSQNPIPYAGSTLAGKLSRMLGDLPASEKPEVMNVPVDSLMTTQEWVSKEALRGIDKKYHNKLDDVVAGNKSGIEVVSYRGQLYVIDGNHRATLALLRGVKRIKARVYYL